MVSTVFNEIYEPVFTTKARYVDVWGGRGRGGSHFGTDYFLFLITKPQYFRGVFMREVFNDIRTSLFQDFKDRIAENETVNENDFEINEQKMSILYKPNGNTIISKGFKKSSSKQSAKLKSLAGCTHILIEECEEVDEFDFDTLDASLRTTKADIQVIRIFNPPDKNHWLIKKYYNLQESDVNGYYQASPKQMDELLSIFSTYHDNIENINPKTIQIFEGFKQSNPPYYYSMIKGLISEGKIGRIYKNWKPITENEFWNLPYQLFAGLDFGYSNDPNALPLMKFHNNKLYVHGFMYEGNLTNQKIAQKLIDAKLKNIELYCEREGKSIEELRTSGVNALEATKGAGSVNEGIKALQGIEVYYTETSKDLIFEYENYTWALDARKMPTNTPVDKDNHYMDAIRYGYYTKYCKLGLGTETPTHKKKHKHGSDWKV